MARRFVPPGMSVARKDWRQNAWDCRGDLAVAITTPTDGFWQSTRGIWPFSVVVRGTFTGLEADLLASNDERFPPDDDNDYPILFTFEELKPFGTSLPYAFLKLRVRVISSGTLYAAFYASAGSTD
jgi:hypothetical protein